MKKHFILIAFLFFFSSIRSQDWTLENCISYANKYNKELIEKTANNKISKIEEAIQYAEFLPEFDFNINSDHYWKIPVESYPAELLGGEEGTTIKIPIGTPWMSSYGINLRWKLFDIESINKLKLSVLHKKSSEISSSNYLKIIRKNVTLAFYSTQINRERMISSKKYFNDYNIIHNLIFEQLEKGLIDKITFNQSKNILINCKSQYIFDEKEYHSSMMNLKFWMGYPLCEEIRIPKNYENPIYLSQITFIDELLPEYKDYENEILIAKQHRKIATSYFIPKVSLYGSYGQKGFGDNPSELFKKKWYPSGYIGIGLNIPIFSFKDHKIIKKHNETILQKKYRMNTYLESQKKDFLITHIKLKSDWENIKIKQEQYKNSEECLLLSLEKVQQCIMDITQLQTVQRDFSTAKDELYNSYIEYVKHYIDINYLQNNE